MLANACEVDNEPPIDCGPRRFPRANRQSTPGHDPAQSAGLLVEFDCNSILMGNIRAETLYVGAIQFAVRPFEGGDSNEKVLNSVLAVDGSQPAFFRRERTS